MEKDEGVGGRGLHLKTTTMAQLRASRDHILAAGNYLMTFVFNTFDDEEDGDHNAQ